MNIRKFISSLAEKRITLNLVNGKIKVSAPAGTITTEIRKELSLRKAEILDYLQEYYIGAAWSEQPIKPRPEDSSNPLSFSQQRLWFVDKLEQGSAQYNILVAIRMVGHLKPEALQKTFSSVLERHESLRTAFPEKENGPQQFIQPVSDFNLSLVDLSGVDDVQQKLKIHQLREAEASSVFDLSCDLMLRAQLIKLSEGEHILLVTMHHIASDGWSAGILVKELSQLYQAYAAGHENPLSPLAIQYADYAHWQREWLQGEVLDKQIDYWQCQLSNLPVVHNIPLDNIRPQRQTFSGASVSAQLSKDSLQRLNALCVEQDVTLFVGLHAAFSILLARYSGQSDIVIGSPIANREQAEVADLIGFFVNTLVLRSDVSGSPSFIDLLQQSKQTALDAYAHQQVPFEQLVEALQPERSLSHSPLFQIMLVLQNNEIDTLNMEGLTLSLLSQPQSHSKFDLTLYAEETDSGLALEWGYNTDIFERTTIERMAAHFVSLLDGLLDDSDGNVYDIEYLSEKEVYQLLVGWNDTQAEYPEDRCIHELFELQVKNNPEGIALVFENRQLSYQELNKKSNQLAHYLISQRNVKPDTLVGICLERSFDLVIAIMGVVKAGGAYVPLDPDYPEARLIYMLGNAALDTVITCEEILSRTPVAQAQSLCLDNQTVQSSLLAHSDADVSIQKIALTSKHLAYVLYTSGSTGKPKGVMVEHQAIVNRIHWMHRQYKASPNDIVLQKTPCSFDVSVWEFFGAITIGAKLVIAEPKGHTDPAYLCRLIQEQKITTLHFVPPILRALLAGPDIAGCLSVKQVFSGGESLTPPLVRDFYQSFSNAELHHLYGPTEAAVDVTSWECPADESPYSVVPIGRPIDNIQLYVLDKQLKLVPQGVVGELHIGGVGLARGYLKRPELTTEKFIKNSFSGVSEARLYKTGDLVRWLPDGALEFMGRIDDQVKIRGFRIELGEIENSLLAHYSIKEVVVVAREEAGDKRIVAYVVTSEDTPQDETIVSTQMDAWRHFLSQSLPDYMLPSSFMVLDALPLTPNGKVDRKALPAPDISQQQNIYVAPATDTEKVLCEIWQYILGLELVGVTDNFFRLGGHSLLLIQLLAQLQKTGRHTDVRTLFSAVSLGELATQLDAMEDSAESVFSAPDNLISESCDSITPEMLSLITLDQTEINSITAAVPGGAENIQDIYPLAPLQEGILFHHQVSAGAGDTYVMPVLLETKTLQQRDDFLQALQKVVNRHDVLRSAVLWEGLSQAVQVVCRQVDLSISSLTLNLDEEVLPQLLEKMEPAEQAMDITQAPLFRVQLAEDPQSDQYFILLQLHHIISDHVGLEIIQAEVQAIIEGREGQLSLAEPYREFVAHTLHQAKTLNTETFFRGKLSSIAEPTAPFDLLDVHGSGSDVVEVRQQLSEKLSHDIRMLSQRLAVSSAALFHSVFGLVVGICSGRDDVVFGTVLSGRLQGTSGAGHMMGMFINTLPIRLTLQGVGSEALVLQAQAELLDLLPYEQASLALAQQCSGLPNGTPLFSAMLNYRHSASADNDVMGNSGIKVIHGHERTNYPFVVSVDDLDDGFALTAQMNAAIDPARVVEYLQTAMEGLVDALYNAPQKLVLDIGVISARERLQLLQDRNDTETDCSTDKCIHELFEEQEKNNPEAIALVFEEQKVSYRELNNKANQLAHYLLAEKNVLPDTLVGVCLERSLEMVVAILGVLKAGAAYVPLDPDYPEARLAYMLDDAALETVITHSNVLARTPIASEHALCWDDENIQQKISDQSYSNLNPQKLGLSSAHLAYVIYTSGSTGKPKGVMISHKGLPSLVDDNGEQFQVCKESRFLQNNSINFDAASWVVWMSLARGATLFIAKKLLMPKDELRSLIVQNKISHLMMTPASLNLLDPGGLPNLKCVIVGGDNCLQELADRWSPSCLFFNAYGPTENTICTTVKKIECGDVVNIGKPVHNTQVYVSCRDSLLPTGVAGELCIGGVGLARGYLNRPELTAEKFIPNPFSDVSSDRLYKTGDLVRWLPDGNLEYLGRSDDQVKIRGFRIELGEIENTLLAHESINDTVVTVREDDGDKRIVAYVVSRDDLSADEPLASTQIDIWRQHLSQCLPEYMLPSSFVVLDELPLTSNGKVDRKALPAPDMSQQQDAYVAPITETEKVLCEIWQEILGLEQVGVTDNFFRLGGHSLLLIQLLARLQETGRHSDVRTLFSTESLGELAALLDETAENSPHGFSASPNLIPEFCDSITPEMLSLISLEQPAIDRITMAMPGGAANIQDIYPLAPLQEGILFHHQMSENVGDPYVLPALLAVKTREQRDDFLRALQIVVNRHDVLRSAVLWQGLPLAVQVVCRHIELPVEHIALSPDKEVMPQLLEQMAPEQQAMDLSQAPLLRVQLAEDPQSEQYFILLKLHHIISDHVGLEIIQTEVQAILQGKENTLMSPVSYREFVAHALHQAKTLNADIFFQEKIGSITEPTAPFNLLDVHGNGGEVLEAKQQFPEKLSQDIRRLAKKLAVTPAAFFHTVFGLVVGACSGRDDVVFGTVLSGRLQGTLGAGQMLGMFINTLPFRLTLPDMGSEELVLQAQAELLDLLPYEQASLALAQKCSGLSSGTPLFSAMLNYRHSAPADNDLTDNAGIEVLHGHERTNYPFVVSVDDLSEGFALTAQVNASISPERVVGYLQTAMEGLVEALGKFPEKPVLDVGVVPAQERHQLLVEWNDTKTDYPEDHCIHELFEEQVTINPDAVALVFEEQQLSYGDLNRKANQLSHYLVNEKNVRPDTLVGICFERSLDMIIAILAILKAGGAYVPLDPGYPEARLAYMLEDAALDTVITNRDVLARTPITSGQALCWGDSDVQQKISEQPLDNLTSNQLGLAPNHLAYVIYTSGSTGKPKGVMVEHRAVVRLVKNTNFIAVENVKAMAQASNMSFDAATFEVWGALLSGAKLVHVSKNELLNASLLQKKIEEHAIDTLFVTTALFKIMSETSPSCFSQLSNVFFGGEKSSIHSVRTVAEFGKPNRLVHVYGPTENTTFSTWKNLTLDYINNTESLAIGESLSNTTAYVVNHGLTLQPIGVGGELLLGGEGLSRGYLNRPDLTAEKFIQNPFSDDPSDRLYKTGDLVRWLPDGNLEFMGRLDDQVKIRGFRIELGEIENTLLEQESIKETVVVAREDSGGKRIVAYVVASNKVPEDESLISAQIEAWREQLSQSLPEYMIPSSFIVLESLPLTANGKVDHKALPAPDMSQQQDTYVAPSTDTEKVLCEIWQDILGLDQVGVTDNFFRLGGHSLLLVQLLTRLQEADRHTDVRSLFNSVNLGELATLLDANKESAASAFSAPANLIPESCDALTPAMLSLITLDQTAIDNIASVMPGGAANIQDIYPLAPLQEGILFHHQMSDGAGDPYVLPVLLATKTCQQRDDFLQALQRVVNRHDVLRSAVLWQGLPQAVQVVCRHADLPITPLVLMPNAEVMPQLQQQLSPAQQFMDITKGPLLRVRVADDPVSGQYFILLQYHHIINDHVALEIIKSEVQAILDGKEDTLTSPALYREFVAHALHQAKTFNAERFFQDKLGSVTEPTAPFNLLDVRGNGGDIVEAYQPLSHKLSQHIRTLSRRLAVSPAALFHTAFGLVVGACSGRDDVVFGTVLLGRLQGTVDVGRMLGMFINTLPCRLTFQGMCAEAMVLQVQAELSALLPYEQASLAIAQQCSGLPSDTPLFSAMLNYRHSAPADHNVSSNSDIDVLHAHERSNYPFSVSVDDLGEDFALTAQVSEVIDPVRVVEYLQTAVEGLVDALDHYPQKPVLDIDILSVVERHQLLVAWNDTETDYSKECCIHELFEEQVKNNPEAIALVFEKQQLSYGDLNRKANQLARYLVTVKNVQPNTLVGICLERSLDMVIAIFGVLKSGAAYVPLDPEYPQARLAYMLEDAALDTVITNRDVLARTPTTSDQALCLDEAVIQRAILSHSHENIIAHELGLTSNDLAYVIYTSGSTGKPKGVEIIHSAVVNFLQVFKKRLDLGVDDCWLAVTPISFDIAVLEIYLPLISNSRVVIASSFASKNEHSLAALIRDSGTTVMQATPATWTMLQHLNEIPVLRHALVGGDVFPLSLAQEMRPKMGSLFNLYGPTEATVWATIMEFPENVERMLIGKPMDNTSVYVVSKQLTLTPTGVPGELLIGGAGLARGYINRLELTAEKFIQNPFSDAPEDRLYKTGDLVRWLPDGNIEFLGRLDDQVKIRGFRIELGEIENTLLAHDSIKDAVVVAREDNGDKRLVAYVVTDIVVSDDMSKDESLVSSYMETWRQYLNQSLPEYMLPSSFVVLDVLPLTPNGKIDRKALPAPNMTQQQDAYVAPTNNTEKVLCDIWQDILGVEKAGVSDNFFRLGGHSLLATRMISQVNSILAVKLSLKIFFETNTVQALAIAIEGLDSTSHQPAIVRVSRSQPLLLSHGQQRLWFIDQMTQGSAQYNMPAALRLSGHLNLAVLQQALSTLVDRHESLRTIFVDDGEGPLQHICPSPAFKLSMIDLSDLDLLTQEEKVRQYFSEESHRAFDLSRDLMLRVELIKSSEDEHILLATMHHIASDGWSVSILVGELSQLYQAYVEGNENPLAPLAIQYADYAHWQREWLQGEVLNKQIDYWQGQLLNLPVLHNLPLDKVRPQRQTFSGARVNAKLSKASLDKLNALCIQYGATLFMGLHAAFSVLLARYSGESDIVIGSPIANREQAEVEDLIGFFVNTLVLRSDVSGSPSFIDLLQQSRRTALDAYAHQQVPFEQLVEVLQPERSLSHSPLFQVILVLQNNEKTTLELPGLTLSSIDQPKIQAKFDLTLNVADTDQGLALDWEFNTDLFERTTIERMASHFESLLERFLASPNENVYALKIVDEHERHQLLMVWNDQKVVFPQDHCIHELFEEKVENNPESIALVFEDQQLSYSELNNKANQLAHYLVAERNVKPDMLVGICLERSLDMVVAILAILKSGGAYVPLDPAYPEARLSYILDDAGLDTVITSSDVFVRTPITSAQALCLNSADVQTEIALQRIDNLTRESLGIRPSDLAYVIYTSGSTGNPKGVLVDHNNVMRLFKASEPDFKFDEQDVWTLFHSYAFDFSVWELWGALMHGGRLVVVPYWVSRSPDDFYSLLVNENVTILNQTPSAFNSVVAVDEKQAKTLSLRCIIFGGEKLNPRLIIPWMNRHGDQSPQLINMYGITETTVHVTYRQLLINDLKSHNEKSVIGRPLADLSTWVLNSENQLTPVGVAGELHVGGSGLTRGYLNRPELTADKFIQNPFSDDPKDRLYKTGDLVRWLPDGDLEYLDRLDDQVKIRGFRIELGEIENALLAHDAIQDVVVIAREDTGDKRLVAYVVIAVTEWSADSEDDVLLSTQMDAWRQHLSQTLPEYMMPSSFVVLDTLPLTPNGKVNRKVLPAPDMSQEQGSYVAPSTDTEKELCSIWQDILGLEKVGVTDNFFRLGGHSLLVTKLLVRINTFFKVTLNIVDIFTFEDVVSIGKLVDARVLNEKNKKLKDKTKNKMEMSW